MAALREFVMVGFAMVFMVKDFVETTTREKLSADDGYGRSYGSPYGSYPYGFRNLQDGRTYGSPYGSYSYGSYPYGFRNLQDGRSYGSPYGSPYGSYPYGFRNLQDGSSYESRISSYGSTAVPRSHPAAGLPSPSIPAVGLPSPSIPAVSRPKRFVYSAVPVVPAPSPAASPAAPPPAAGPAAPPPAAGPAAPAAPPPIHVITSPNAPANKQPVQDAASTVAVDGTSTEDNGDGKHAWYKKIQDGIAGGKGTFHNVQEKAAGVVGDALHKLKDKSNEAKRLLLEDIASTEASHDTRAKKLRVATPARSVVHAQAQDVTTLTQAPLADTRYSRRSSSDNTKIYGVAGGANYEIARGAGGANYARGANYEIARGEVASKNVPRRKAFATSDLQRRRSFELPSGRVAMSAGYEIAPKPAARLLTTSLNAPDSSNVFFRSYEPQDRDTSFRAVPRYSPASASSHQFTVDNKDAPESSNGLFRPYEIQDRDSSFSPVARFALAPASSQWFNDDAEEPLGYGTIDEVAGDEIALKPAARLLTTLNAPDSSNGFFHSYEPQDRDTSFRAVPRYSPASASSHQFAVDNKVAGDEIAPNSVARGSFAPQDRDTSFSRAAPKAPASPRSQRFTDAEVPLGKRVARLLSADAPESSNGLFRSPQPQDRDTSFRTVARFALAPASSQRFTDDAEEPLGYGTVDEIAGGELVHHSLPRWEALVSSPAFPKQVADVSTSTKTFGDKRRLQDSTTSFRSYEPKFRDISLSPVPRFALAPRSHQPFTDNDETPFEYVRDDGLTGREVGFKSVPRHAVFLSPPVGSRVQDVAFTDSPH